MRQVKEPSKLNNFVLQFINICSLLLVSGFVVSNLGGHGFLLELVTVNDCNASSGHDIPSLHRPRSLKHTV